MVFVMYKTDLGLPLATRSDSYDKGTFFPFIFIPFFHRWKLLMESDLVLSNPTDSSSRHHRSRFLLFPIDSRVSLIPIEEDRNPFHWGPMEVSGIWSTFFCSGSRRAVSWKHITKVSLFSLLFIIFTILNLYSGLICFSAFIIFIFMHSLRLYLSSVIEDLARLVIILIKFPVLICFSAIIMYIFQYSLRIYLFIFSANIMNILADDWDSPNITHYIFCFPPTFNSNAFNFYIILDYLTIITYFHSYYHRYFLSVSLLSFNSHAPSSVMASIITIDSYIHQALQGKIIPAHLLGFLKITYNYQHLYFIYIYTSSLTHYNYLMSFAFSMIYCSKAIHRSITIYRCYSRSHDIRTLSPTWLIKRSCNSLSTY